MLNRGYLSDYDFQPPEKWDTFAKKWKIPAQDVAALFRRLEDPVCDGICTICGAPFRDCEIVVLSHPIQCKLLAVGDSF